MNIRINKILPALLSILLLAATAISFASCNKDDDKDNDKAKGNNDLAAFQSMFVEIDASGDFVGRYNGVPLYESDTAHLYFPVEDIKEALKCFESTLAPDIERQKSDTYHYTYTLTDASGNSQGTVTFAPGTGTSVAEVTTNLPGLKYFNKVTFLQKDAWPLNDGLPRWLEKILDSMY